MRRLIVLSFVAASFAAVAPAHASYSCEGVTGTVNAGACVQVGSCSDLCFIEPGVYLYCTGTTVPSAQAACAATNKVHVQVKG
jgi:hypothetical protein